jgi:hypothetical protein
MTINSVRVPILAPIIIIAGVIVSVVTVVVDDITPVTVHDLSFPNLMLLLSL